MVQLPVFPLIGELRKNNWYSSLLATRDLDALSSLITANRLYAMLFPVPLKARFDRIAIWIDSAGTTGSKARLGIYDTDGNLYPKNLVLDAGEVAIDVVGLREITIDQTLEADNYFLAFNFSGSPRTLYTTDFLRAIRATTISTGYAGWRVIFTYGPLPTTFPSGASEEPYLYDVKLRLLETL